MRERTSPLIAADSPDARPALDWDDLRFVLAVAEGGSLNAGAAALGVRHSTVLRRLDALERRLDARLFERRRQGYVATESGEMIATQARQMRPAIDELQRRILGRDLQLQGSVRLNTSFIAMLYLLPQPMAAFAQAHPAIEVEVNEASSLVDLSRRDADVALRLSAQAPQHMVGRALGTVRFKVYALRGHASLPQQVLALSDLLAAAPWVGFERGRSARFYERWALAHLPEARTVFRVDLLHSMAAMLRTGVGVGILPCFAGDQEPLLRPVSDEIPALDTPLWLLSHPDLRQTARIRRFVQHLAEMIPPLLAPAGAGLVSTGPARPAAAS